MKTIEIRLEAVEKFLRQRKPKKETVMRIRFYGSLEPSPDQNAVWYPDPGVWVYDMIISPKNGAPPYQAPDSVPDFSFLGPRRNASEDEAQAPTE